MSLLVCMCVHVCQGSGAVITCSVLSSEPSEKQFVQAELKWKIEKPKRGATEWVRDGVYNTDEWKPITEGILVSEGFKHKAIAHE